ncbi:MAG: hypothetical protein AB7O24_15075 [Kofleriaceae bacterium]
MLVKRSWVAAIVMVAAPAAADTFGGFSGVDRPYLVNQDRVCSPLQVVGAAATGIATCHKAAADVVAKLSIKDPIVQRGAKARFAASASGRVLAITRDDGQPIVRWTASDPIGKVVDVFASQYDDRVAVTYTVRRAGKELTEVIAFDLGKPSVAAPATDPPSPETTKPGAPPAGVAPPPEEPAVTKAVAAARKASKAKALAAWKAVLAIDGTHAESIYRVAAIQAAAKQPADAIATLGQLASSKRSDAIEWLIEARFDPAFAALRADPTFRKTVGLDRSNAAASSYERLMGMGGQWEQSGTSCDTPEVRFTATRDRVVRIRVKSACQGNAYNLPFKGTWRIDGDRVVITLPNQGRQVTDADEAACKFEPAGDELSLRCSLGRDLEFVVLPTRR